MALVRELRTTGELVLEHETENVTVRLMGVRFPQQASLPRTLSDTWAGRMAHVCFFPGTELVVVFHEEDGPTLNQEVVRFGLAASDTRTGMAICAELSPYLPTNLTSTTPIPAPKPTIESSMSPCDCSRAVECVDFQTREEAQACYNACADYRFTALDPDHDGFACEELP